MSSELPGSPVVVVERLDRGPGKGVGDYLCGLCGWEGHGWPKIVKDHMRILHPGCTLSLKRRPHKVQSHVTPQQLKTKKKKKYEDRKVGDP